jgi:MIP family channel proteins
MRQLSAGVDAPWRRPYTPSDPGVPAVRPTPEATTAVMLDDTLLVQAMLAVTAATVLLCVYLLAPSARRASGRLHARLADARLHPEALTWARCWVAEALGTFALVFAGVLSISGAAVAGAPALSLPGPGSVANLASVGLASGLTVAVMVASLGAISGGHFNPAVTFGFLLTGRVAPLRGTLYWSAQLSGATAAAALIAGLFGRAAVAAATPDLPRPVSFAAGSTVEAVTTFFLVLVVFGTADRRVPKGAAPLAVGLTVALGVMAAGPLTGAALNPARAFGPALAAGHWHNHLVYWFGPMVGGGLAALVQHYFLMGPPATIRLAESSIVRRPADRYLDDLAA